MKKEGRERGFDTSISKQVGSFSHSTGVSCFNVYTAVIKFEVPASFVCVCGCAYENAKNSLHIDRDRFTTMPIWTSTSEAISTILS